MVLHPEGTELTVAWHEVPGKVARKVQSQSIDSLNGEEEVETNASYRRIVSDKKHLLQNGIILYHTGRITIYRKSRHFVPGYLLVPPGRAFVRPFYFFCNKL